MMDNTLKYKGYHGSVEYSAEDNILYGKVMGVRGLISYEGEDLSTLKVCFMESVDEYLASCEAEAVEPMGKLYGKIENVMISPDLHRDFEMYSIGKNKKMSEALEEAMKQYIAV